MGYKTYDVKSDAKILTERMIGIEQDFHYSSGEKKTDAVLTGVYFLHMHLREQPDGNVDLEFLGKEDQLSAAVSENECPSTRRPT
ncbi:hypothetical protein [Mycobacterium sp. E3247]|uniref:hypothetical protein n=1 Tax=Mycobacterium sp. E3247 TaxID=1856864 RepID=UPI0012EAB7F5|nr:hypothetical protein [Mycobacterium sp. E3247]